MKLPNSIWKIVFVEAVDKSYDIFNDSFMCEPINTVDSEKGRHVS